MHSRQRLLDEADALDRLDAGADVVLVAGADREDQRVEEDVLRPRRRTSSVSSSCERCAIGELALARDRLRLLLVLVDAADHQRRAVAARQRHDALEALLAVLEVDRVDDRLALRALERLLDRRCASVESIMIGTLTFFTSISRKAVTSARSRCGRDPAGRRRGRARRAAPAARPTSAASSILPAAISCLNLRLPSTLVRSPTITGRVSSSITSVSSPRRRVRRTVHRPARPVARGDLGDHADVLRASCRSSRR